jgi:hypothetical protein
MVGKRCWSRRDICLRHSTYDTRQYLENVQTLITSEYRIVYCRLRQWNHQCTYIMNVLKKAHGLPTPGRRPNSVLT